MGFYNSKGNWECVDECVYSKNGQICGDTDHFTSFAILLGANTDTCDSNLVISYLSLAVICTCGIIVLISFAIIEIRMRIITFKRNSEFRVLADSIDSKLQNSSMQL